MDTVSFCRDCSFCRLRPSSISLDGVFCSKGKFTEKSMFDILDYIPEDFDCEDWEGDPIEYYTKWR